MEFSDTLLEPKWWIPHRLRYFADLGLEVNEEAWEHLPLSFVNANTIPEPGDEVILSDQLFDDGGWETPKISVNIFQVACRSSSWQVSTSEALARLDRYSHLGLELPTAEIREMIRAISLSREDLIVLSFRLDGESPYFDTIGGSQMLYASAALKEPLGNVHRRLKRLAALGVEVVDVDLALCNLIVSPLEAQVVRIMTEWTCALGNLVSAAVQTGQSLLKIYETYCRFVPLLAAPPAWRLVHLKTISPEPHDAILLSKQLQGSPPWLSEISRDHITAAAAKLAISAASVARALRKYEPRGLILPAEFRAKRKKRRES